MDAWVVGAYAGGVPGSGLTLDGDLAFIQRRVGVPLPCRASRSNHESVGPLYLRICGVAKSRASPTAAVRRAGHPCLRRRMVASSHRTRAPRSSTWTRRGPPATSRRPPSSRQCATATVRSPRAFAAPPPRVDRARVTHVTRRSRRPHAVTLAFSVPQPAWAVESGYAPVSPASASVRARVHGESVPAATRSGSAPCRVRRLLPAPHRSWRPRRASLLST